MRMLPIFICGTAVHIVGQKRPKKGCVSRFVTKLLPKDSWAQSVHCHTPQPEISRTYVLIAVLSKGSAHTLE